MKIIMLYLFSIFASISLYIIVFTHERDITELLERSNRYIEPASTSILLLAIVLTIVLTYLILMITFSIIVLMDEYPRDAWIIGLFTSVIVCLTLIVNLYAAYMIPIEVARVTLASLPLLYTIRIHRTIQLSRDV